MRTGHANQVDTPRTPALPNRALDQAVDQEARLLGGFDGEVAEEGCALPRTSRRSAPGRVCARMSPSSSAALRNASVTSCRVRVQHLDRAVELRVLREVPRRDVQLHQVRRRGEAAAMLERHAAARERRARAPGSGSASAPGRAPSRGRAPRPWRCVTTSPRASSICSSHVAPGVAAAVAHHEALALQRVHAGPEHRVRADHAAPRRAQHRRERRLLDRGDVHQQRVRAHAAARARRSPRW